MSATSSDSGAAGHSGAPLQLDLRARRARVGTRELDLEPRSFDLLALLCSEPGRVFDKQALFEQVWAGRVVSDSALVQSVARLRRAIESAGGVPDWIRTVHAVGYAFDGPLAQAGDPAVPDRPRRSMTSWFIAAAAVLALLTVWAWQRPTPAHSIAIAMVPFQVDAHAADLEWGQLALPDMLTDVLSERTGITTIQAHRVRAALTRLGVDENADEATQASLLRDVFGVDYVLFGRLDRRGDALHLSYRVVAPAGGRLSGDADGLGAGALAAATAAGIARNLDVAYEAGIPLRRLSSDEFVNEAYARGMQALLSGRSEDARGYFETALRVDPDAHWIRYEFGNALLHTQQWDAAAKAYHEALEHASRNGDRDLAGAAHSGLGTLEWRAGQLDLAEQHFERARVEFASAQNRANLASAIGNLGILADNRGDLERARALYEEALQLYLAEGERAGESAVYSNLAVIERRRGNLAQAARYQRQGAELQRRIGLDQMRVFSENHLATIERLLGHFERASAHLATASALAQANQDQLGLADATLGRAWLDFDVGRQIEAEAGARDAVAIYERLQNPASEAAARALLAEILIDRDIGQARTQRERVESIAASIEDQGVQVLSRLLAARFDADALPAAVSIAQTARDPLALAEAAWLQARHSGDARHWQQALQMARATGVPRSEARAADDWLRTGGEALGTALRQDLQRRIDAWRVASDDSAAQPPSAAERRAD